MANRRLEQFTYSSEKMPTHVFAQITFGSTGAPTLNFGGGFITSVTRNSAGDYTIVFKDKWSRLLGVSAVFNSGASLPAAPFMCVKDNSVAAAGKSIEIVFADGDTPAATDPASGEIVYLDFVLKNSSV